MLTLYYAPGACSMAAHIVLEETGEKYQPQKVDLAGGEQRTEGYLKINPQGRVPALKLDDGEPLAEREWFGDNYSVVDPYGFVFYTWGVRRELPMGELKNYTAFKDCMLKRPAVKRVVEDEKVMV